MNRPDYLVQGEAARLFPVLATTSKEGRTTSILLGCISKIDESGAALLESVGKRAGKRSKIETYTEIVFKTEKVKLKDRPVPGHGYETARCAGHAAILTPVTASGSRAFCSALI